MRIKIEASWNGVLTWHKVVGAISGIAGVLAMLHALHVGM